MEGDLIRSYNLSDRQSIINIWEKSVLATHDFLDPKDFEEYKVIVNNLNFNDLEVYCLEVYSKVVGFIALYDYKIEMLFIDPSYIGKGYGKTLIEFAINNLKAIKVDVNEQNKNAYNFYKKFGFEIYERSEKDDQGKNYPILRMGIVK